MIMDCGFRELLDVGIGGFHGDDSNHVHLVCVLGLDMFCFVVSYIIENVGIRHLALERTSLDLTFNWQIARSYIQLCI